MSANRLLLVIPVLLLIGALALSAALVAKAEGPNWNAPEPAIMRLPFPTAQEMGAKAVTATSEERADAMKWIAEFLKPEAIPDGLEQHLLALKDAVPRYPVMMGSGYPVSSDAPADALEMAPGFVVKYEAQGHAFQVMETRGRVIVGVQPLSGVAAKTSEADRIAFVTHIIRRFVKPQPADPFIIARHFDPRATATYGAYSPIKQTAGAEGNYALDPQAKGSAFVGIPFATDGKAVIFQASKNLDPAEHMKPRFSALAAPPG